MCNISKWNILPHHISLIGFNFSTKKPGLNRFNIRPLLEYKVVRLLFYRPLIFAFLSIWPILYNRNRHTTDRYSVSRSHTTYTDIFYYHHFLSVFGAVYNNRSYSPFHIFLLSPVSTTDIYTCRSSSSYIYKCIFL